MPRRILLMCVLMGVVFSCGCRQDTNPPPRFNKPMSVNGQVLMPSPPLTPRTDESLLRPIAEAPTGAGPARRGEDESTVEVDDSNAEAAANSYVRLVTAGDMGKVANILVPEQAEVFSAPVGTDVILPAAGAVHDLMTALDEKFPGHAIQIAGVDEFIYRLGDLTARFSVEEVTPINDDEAEATLVLNLPNQQQKKETVTVRRSGDRWRLEFPNLQTPSDLDGLAQTLAGKADGFRSIAERLRSGDLADEVAVKAEIDKVMAGTYEAPTQAEREAPVDNQAAPEREPYRAPPQRDAVDDTIAVPGLLNRG